MTCYKTSYNELNLNRLYKNTNPTSILKNRTDSEESCNIVPMYYTYIQ